MMATTKKEQQVSLKKRRKRHTGLRSMSFFRCVLENCGPSCFHRRTRMKKKNVRKNELGAGTTLLISTEGQSNSETEGQLVQLGTV